MLPCFSLLIIKLIWFYMVSALPSHYMGWQNVFLHFWQDKPLLVESKIYRGVIFITILKHFHYFISLETTNTQKSEVFLLRISLGNENTPVVTCWYLQKWGLDRISIFRGGNFFQRVQFLHKNKLKFEIFNKKKRL